MSAHGRIVETVGEDERVKQDDDYYNLGLGPRSVYEAITNNYSAGRDQEYGVYIQEGVGRRPGYL